ncbi:hypothetical protein AB0I81_62460 [Nonomuraea sp. NPDC050404]|uniref:hypothetical protein n=1 Tax=Nonomuraea sp. NPDC050404 TaxID=3155783 RepID=UPI00340AC2C7
MIGVTSNTWVSARTPVASGTEILNSDRAFYWLAHSPTHSRILLRSSAYPDPNWPDAQGRNWDTTLDILFAGVDTLKIRSHYEGLNITTASSAETVRIKESTPSIELDDALVFVLQSQGETDYVVASGVGWRDDVLNPVRHSHFTHVDPDQPFWPTQALDHIYPSSHAASVEDLIAALAAHPATRPHRERHRWAFLVMTRVDRGLQKIPDISGAGVFLTRQDAEDAVALISPHVAACWIEDVPIAI